MPGVKRKLESASQPTRRQRARAATRAEILAAARALLVAGGVEEVTLRGIAAELGMTAPALYRYFDSRERLLAELINGLYEELADVLEEGRDAVPRSALKRRFLATSDAFRGWALDHRPEFGLLFGAPIPGVPDRTERQALDSDRGQRFGQIWLDLFVELWQKYPDAVPADGDVDPALRRQLAGYHERVGKIVPIGALALYLSCWMRLYGAVATEAFGHLDFALPGGADALFHDLMRETAQRLGLTH